MACDMHRREAYIEQQVCKYAKARGWRHRKVQYIGRRGAPDQWFKRDGQLVMIEFKDPNGALSVAQKREVNWLRSNGFEVHVVDDIEEGKAIFDAYDDADD